MSFGRLVGIVALSVVVVTLLIGRGHDVNTMGFVGLLVAMFWGLPAIIVITLYRAVQKRDHGL
jgi:uncharacterized membrane protein